MSDTTEDPEALNSSDCELVHDDSIKNTISKFLQDDVDCSSSCGTSPKTKTSSLPNETTAETYSHSERTGSEISADDARDILSEESRGSELPHNSDEKSRDLSNGLSIGRRCEINEACSLEDSAKNRIKKAEKDLKLCKKSLKSEHKPRHDNSKSLHGDKSCTKDKKTHHSGHSLNSSKNSHHDGSSREKIHRSQSNHPDKKSFTNGGQLLGCEKYVREEVKTDAQARCTASESTETESVAVDARDMLSEDSRTSELLDDFTFGSSHKGRETLSTANRSNPDENPCKSTSSHDIDKFQCKDVKKSSDIEQKPRTDSMSYRAEKSHTGDNRSQRGDKSHSSDKRSQSGSQSGDKSHSSDKRSHHSKAKTQDGHSGLNDKKSHYATASGNRGGKQLSGCDKSAKKENFLAKTSQNEIKTGTKARTPKSEIMSEDSQTSELWAGFALGDWSHGRTTDRLSIASKSDLDEVSSHCGSSASHSGVKLLKKGPKISSDAEKKSHYDEKKAHKSDRSRESGKKSHHKHKPNDSGQELHHSSNDNKSRHVGKPLNSSGIQLLGAERQSVKDELIPNMQGFQKSSKGLAFFSSSAVSPYSKYSSRDKSPNVKITSKPDASTRLGDSSPIFTKMKISGASVFVERTLRRDPKLWRPTMVTLVNCDQVLAESLAQEHKTFAHRKDIGGYSSVSKASSHNNAESKTWHKEKRASEQSSYADKYKSTSSKDSRLSVHSKDRGPYADHVRKKSYNTTHSEYSGMNSKSNTKKNLTDSDKTSINGSKSCSESRSRESSISSSHKSSDVRHESKPNNSRNSLRENKPNHGGKSQHECELRHSSKSHSKGKSDHKNRSHCDSKSSSHKSKLLLGKSVQSSNSQHSPSRHQSDKESKSRISYCDESSLQERPSQSCRGKTTEDGNTAAEQLKPTKKRIDVFQSDSDDGDSKENKVNKESISKQEYGVSEDSKPVFNESKDTQHADDDQSQTVTDESSKDVKQEEAAEKLEHDNIDEQRHAANSSSCSKGTGDCEHASVDICSKSLNNELNKYTSRLTEVPVKQSELESANEISFRSSDAPLEQRRSEEASRLPDVELESIKEKPESDHCSELVQVGQVDKRSFCQVTCGSDTLDSEDACRVPFLTSGCSDYPQFLEASDQNHSSPNTLEGKEEGLVSLSKGQLSIGDGDCVTSMERPPSNSYDGIVPFVKGAANVSSVDVTTKTAGTEPVTEVCSIKTPLFPQSYYDLEKVKKDVHMQPFVKLKVLDESRLKKLLADYKNSVRKKSLAEVAAEDLSNLSSDSSVKSEIKDHSVEEKVSLTEGKEAKEKKKRSISSTDGSSVDEPPVRRLKVEDGVKREQLNRKDSTSALPDGSSVAEPPVRHLKVEDDMKREQLNRKDSTSALPETLAKSLQKAKAAFKRKGGYPSEMVRDDVKRRKMDAEKAIPNVAQWLLSEQDEKKMSSLSFVIPKVKPGEKRDKTKKKKPQEQLEKVLVPPSAPAISVPRTPKPSPLPKTLTEEDKGRSVLAKLEDVSAEHGNLRWETRDNSWKGKSTIRASKWQPFNAAEDQWKRPGQDGPRWRNCNSGGPRDVVDGTVGSDRFHRWNSGSSSGYPRNSNEATFSSSSSSSIVARQRAQQSTHSVVNDKVDSSSSDWVRLYNRDPLRLEDPSANDDCSAAFSPPGVADEENDDVPVDPKFQIPSRKLSTDDPDSMVENVRVLAEAIQEVLVEGTISSARRDKLLGIYTRLQRNLNSSSDVQEGNTSFLNTFCGSSNQTLMTINMFKDLLQHSSTPSQPDTATALINLPPVINEGVRSDVTQLAARDMDLRDSQRVALGNQDVDHRMDAQCNMLRGFNQRALSGTPISSSGSPRCPVIGKSDVPHGLLPSPLASSRSSELQIGQGLVINPKATYMDIDERSTRLKDIDERSASVRNLAERELATQFTTNEIKCSADPSLLQKESGSSVVHTPNSMQQSTAGADVHKTIFAQKGTTVDFKTETVSGSFRMVQPQETKPPEMREVSKSKEVLRQEAIASRIEDELQLLEMLVTIQCELADVSSVPEISNDTQASEVADPVPVPKQASKTSDKISSGISNVVSNSPMCATATNSVVDEESQDSAAHLSSKGTPQQKADDEKAAARSKALEDRVISLARNALKPFYHKSQITSEEFKLIMRKAIAKIKVREGEELKEAKVTQLIHAYVDNIIHRRKKMTL